MIQTLGIALGNANCYVAAAKDGGIEILLNDYSQRSTPAMVAFGEFGRLIGVDASQNQMMNLKNTIYNLLKLVGRPYSEAIALNLPFKLEEGEDGQVYIVVTHLREERRFTVVQILAMLFTKLKDIAGVADCVINCPQFYNQEQRQVVNVAARIAGFNPLDIIPDMSAVALYYTHYRTKKTDATNNIVGFVNFGQSCLQTMIAYINPKDDVITVLAAESEPDIGGRDFDLLLAEYFIKTQNMDLSPKAKLRLVNECERLKKQLSANSNSIPIHVECLESEDKDFSGSIDRATFEQLAEGLLSKVHDCLSRTIEKAKDQFALIQKIQLEQAKKSKSDSKKKTPSPKKPEAEQNKQAEEEKMDLDPSNNDQCTQNSEADPVDKVEQTNEKVESKVDVPSQSPKKEEINPQPPTPFSIHSVEIVGGSSRIPAFKGVVKTVFGLEGSTTINTDEAVARGCVLYCAILHPGIQVKRHVTIKESNPISIDWRTVKVGKELCKIEADLTECDRQWRARMDALNSLEEYIFDCRAKNKLVDEVNSLEDWLFDEGDNCTKEELIDRLTKLKALDTPVKGDSNGNVPEETDVQMEEKSSE